MYRFPRIIANRLLLAALCVPLAGSALRAQTLVRGIKVLGSKDTVEIEVESSDRVVPQTQVLSGPDRLVIDFPNTVPGPQMRNQSVDRGEVKDVRFGRFQGKPPVTLKAGDVLFIPAGTVHSATNVGSVTGSELATYIVEKGKPLLTLVK